MRKIPAILLLAIFAMPALFAQVKIGDNPQAISPTSVLELESNDRVLVITRITTAQMDAIVPNQGAMIYNTDTQCIHYYDGAQWINLCNSAGLVFTTDPIENDVETIVITDQAGTKNFEVAPNSIGSLQIINGGINGVDIQNGSIGPGKLQDQSVTQDKLSENSVGAFALDNANIDLGDFSNGPGFITGADLISGAAGNDITDNGGAFYDDQLLQDNIAANTTAINNIGVPNLNEVLQQGTNAGNLKIEGLATPTNPADAVTKAYVDGLTGGGSDDQNLTVATLNPANNELTIEIENGNPVTVDLDPLAGGGTDGVITNVVYTPADNNLTFTGANGGFNGFINLDDLDGGGGANQNLGQVLTQGNDGGTAQIKNIADPTDPQDAATQAYVLATVASGGALTDGSILIGGAGDVAQQLVISGDATMDNAGVLTISANAIGTAEIDNDAILLEDLNDNGAGDGQIIKWNDTAGAWQVADDDTGTATLTNGNIFVGGAGNVPTDVTMSGDATIDNLGELTIADDAVELDMLSPPDAAGTPTPANGQVIVWDNDNGEWVIDAQAGTHTGISKSIFFADDSGLPTEALHPTNGSQLLIWDYESRVVNGDAYGTLGVGLDDTAINKNVKVHIEDTDVNDLTFPLLLQNSGEMPGTALGILFSNDRFNDGKGSLVFERQGAFGVGDFHFLHNTNNGAREAPVLATDKAFTIKNNKDIRLYGGIDVDGTVNGLGGNGQVLTSTGTGVQWTNKGGNSITDNENDDGLNEFDSTTGYDINVDDTTIEISGDALQIKEDGVSPDKIDESLVDNQVLTTDGTDVVWEDAQNLATGNLIQDNEARTYDMSGQTLSFFNGKIGIGTGTLDADPEVTFHVLGNGQARAGSFKAGNGTAGLPSYRFTENNDTGMFLVDPAGVLGFSANDTEAMRIDATQQVGIGPKFADPINDPIDARLHVDGDIYAEGDFYSTMGTAVQPIPDYVFEHYFLGKSKLKENYDFKSLEEIETFIQNNHHLPGIKSAATAMAEGKWNLGESNIQNLEKIEELFLHTIEQEKKIKTLQSEKDTLTEELDTIKKDLEEIKALLKKSN